MGSRTATPAVDSFLALGRNQTMRPAHSSTSVSSMRVASRRRMLATTVGMGGLSLPAILALQAAAKDAPAQGTRRHAKSLIIVYLWGGMSHIDSLDPKPEAPREVRGEFQPISTATPGIAICEHLPLLARHTEKMAIIRSIFHDDSAHGRGMYWNLTGHAPPTSGGISPKSTDWPTLAAMVSKLRPAASDVPPAVRLPYPMVDGVLQAGEYGGWLGVEHTPIIMRPSRGEEFAGVSPSLGAEVLRFGELDGHRLAERHGLLSCMDRLSCTDRPLGLPSDFSGFSHFHALAKEMMLGSAVKTACDLDREDPRILESYGNHLGGQSMLQARRLTEAGVPVVQVCCAAGNLNGGVGDMWDTHGDNFNRLKTRLLPVLDRGLSALLQDLEDRGTLDDTLVAVLTDFGRSPQVNGIAGREHYPGCYSVLLAGGGIRGGQVFGSSDATGSRPLTDPCGPPDIHATIFTALGLSPRAELRDHLGRPMVATDGRVLPLL